MNDKQIYRGDVYYIGNNDSSGHEIRGARPAVVVSRDSINKSSSVIMVAYMTTKDKAEYAYNVPTKCTGKDAYILCNQIENVDVGRLGDLITTIFPEEMKTVDKGIAYALGLGGGVTEVDREELRAKIKAKSEAEPKIEDNPKYIRAEAERDVYKELFLTMLDRGGKDER
jgi:mRNA-degrading endonuclease toxin of MazEF toxin-antitoxin module